VSQNGVFSAGLLGGLHNELPSLLETVGPSSRLPFYDGLAESSAGSFDDGSLDLGVITGVAGDPQFQFMFEIVGLGSTAIEFGTNLAAGEAVILPGGTVGTSNNALVSIVAVPEPGTALLLGFGLAVLRYTRVGSGCRRSVAN